MIVTAVVLDVVLLAGAASMTAILAGYAWRQPEHGTRPFVGLLFALAYTGHEVFENCHLANYDPDREIRIVGDEVPHGYPGGKHIFDTSDPSDPQPIGYTLSPTAEPQDDPNEGFDWTGHNFDVIPKGKTTLLISGDDKEGAVVSDITDPTDPTQTDQYRTDDKADETHIPFNDVPDAWGTDYNDQRDLVVTSNIATDYHTFEVTPDASNTRGDQ